MEPSPRSTGLRSTWLPALARHYRRPGGPWQVPTLDALLDAHSGELVDADRRLSSQAAQALVSRVAGGLARSGVGPGDAVVWQLPNGLNAALLFRACWRLGAVAVPIMVSMGASERESALAHVDPKYIVTLLPQDSADPDSLLAVLDGPAIHLSQSRARPSGIAVVLFTSGSTGTPKAVLHTHRSLGYKSILMANVHGLSSEDAVLVPAPMAHVSGLLNGVLVPGVAGMRIVYMSRFDPEQALTIIEREKVSFMGGPPTFFIAMARALSDIRAKPNLSSLRLISTGGASVTPAFIESTTEVFDCRVKRTYGSTEAPTMTTSTAQDPFDKARDTDGRAVGEAELRIVGPDGRQCRSGDPGELWVRGPELFAGYADKSQNASVIARGGWFRTGDVAVIEQDWLRIVGRLKDIIIRGGENISAAEVESVLESHPDIHQAVVVGYPDELMGERVCAFVVSEHFFNLDDCREWFAQRGVTRFKTPERVIRLPELPLLGSGKPDRVSLQERLNPDCGL